MKRKWLIAIIILIVVGVVLTVVFINLFGEHSTEGLAKSVNSVVTTGYLSEDSTEYKEVNEYFSKVYDSLDDDAKAEVKNYQNSYKAFITAGNFFNRQLFLGKYSNVYKDNRKVVENAFKSAQSEIDKFVKYIDENNEPISGSNWWKSTTWANCRDFANEWFEQNRLAFSKLSEIYKSTMSSKIVNNDLSDLVFETFNDMTTKIKESVKKDASLGENFERFVKNYMTIDGEKAILIYRFSRSAQGAVADIKENGLENSVYKASFLAGTLAG